MIYLATPIKHPDPAIEAWRTLTASHAARTLHDAGIPVFSPASHGGAFSSLSDVRQSWEYWKQIDLPILTQCCTHLVVLCMEGWAESEGVGAEIDAANSAGLLITFHTLCRCGEKLKQHRPCDGAACPDLSSIILRYGRTKTGERKREGLVS